MQAQAKGFTGFADGFKAGVSVWPESLYRASRVTPADLATSAMSSLVLRCCAGSKSGRVSGFIKKGDIILIDVS